MHTVPTHTRSDKIKFPEAVPSFYESEADKDFMHIKSSLHDVQKWLIENTPTNGATGADFEAGYYLSRRPDAEPDSWEGGNPSRLVNLANGIVDMSAHDAMLAELTRKGVIDKIDTALAPAKPKKRKRWSEHDGEFDQMRKYDPEPFLGFEWQRNGKMARSIDILINGCVNGSTQADDLRKFGALCWAIVSALEATGVSTSITSRFATHGVYSHPNGRKRKYVRSVCLDFAVKEQGEVFNPHQLAFAVDPAFFRRGCFELWNRYGLNLGLNVREGLGHAVKFPTAKGSHGRLCLSPEVNHMNADQVIAEVMKALMGNAQAA